MLAAVKVTTAFPPSLAVAATAVGAPGTLIHNDAPFDRPGSLDIVYVNDPTVVPACESSIADRRHQMDRASSACMQWVVLDNVMVKLGVAS